DWLPSSEIGGYLHWQEAGVGFASHFCFPARQSCLVRHGTVYRVRMDRRGSGRAACCQCPGPRQHRYFPGFVPSHTRTHRGSWLSRYAARYLRTPESRIRPYLLQPSFRNYKFGQLLSRQLSGALKFGHWPLSKRKRPRGTVPHGRFFTTCSQHFFPNDDYGRKLNSSCVVVSPLAGAYFQFFRVSSTALTRIGCPPMTFFSLIRPSAPITTCTFTTPVSRSLLATSGYVGAGLDSALRPSCACKFAAPRPSVIASNAPPRILLLCSFLIATFLLNWRSVIS